MSAITSMELTFLGTCAGKPSLGRNVSSLGLRLDGAIWLFDAGEATQHQLMKSSLKFGNISKIFLTHLHGDHVYGLVPLLLSLPGPESNLPHESDILDIYGPRGIRQLVRQTIILTYGRPQKPFRIHEILLPGEEASVSNAANGACQGEVEGSRDIHQQKDGSWPIERWRSIFVKAGFIQHTVPCWGYVIEEETSQASMGSEQFDALDRNAAALKAQGISNPKSLLGKLQRTRESILLPDGTLLQPPALSKPGRKVTILGDTFDATSMIPMAMGSDLVVHEATNAHLILDDTKPRPGETTESVRALAREHGHSTPEVAGSFANQCQARQLVLNHLSGRYTDPATLNDHQSKDYIVAKAMIEEIERLATEAWSPEDRNARAVAAYDLLKIVVERRPASLL